MKHSALVISYFVAILTRITIILRGEGIVMAIYRRGKIWWYKFYFGKKLIRESAKNETQDDCKGC
jgi:hypothetical protein